MTTSISGGAAISKEDAIPLSTPVDADTETPPTLQSSKTSIDVFDGVQDTSLVNKEIEDVLMPTPEIGTDEIELPPMTKRDKESEPPNVFPSEIPDSDTISDGSPIEDGEKLECAKICVEALSAVFGVDEIPPSSLDSPDQIIANKVFTMDAKEDEMEQAAPSRQCAVPDGTKDISTIPLKDVQTFSKVTIEDNNESTVKLNQIPESPTTHDTRTGNTPTFKGSANKLAIFHINLNSANTFPTGEHLVELDTPVTDGSVPQACTPPINTRKGSIVSGTVVSSPVRSIESIPNIPSSNLDEAPQIFPEKQGKDFVSTKDSSSQTEIENSNSAQTKDVKTPSTPLKRPESSQNKDIMITELKAIKIASLKSRNAALEQEIAQKRARLEETTKELMYPAEETVRKHITLLHNYNDIRDVGQGLIGMIADNRGVRIGELYEEFGVGLKD